jgi:hypothetical protein
MDHLQAIGGLAVTPQDGHVPEPIGHSGPRESLFAVVLHTVVEKEASQTPVTHRVPACFVQRRLSPASHTPPCHTILTAASAAPAR